MLALGNGNKDTARAVVDGINYVKGKVDKIKVSAPLQL
jgi:hypothetical protein